MGSSYTRPRSTASSIPAIGRAAEPPAILGARVAAERVAGAARAAAPPAGPAVQALVQALLCRHLQASGPSSGTRSACRSACQTAGPRRGRERGITSNNVFGIASNTLVRSGQSSSWPAGGASDGYGLGRGAAGPDRRCTTTTGAVQVIV